MIKNFFLQTWRFFAIFVDSIIEGRRLKAEMVMRSRGVYFDKDGKMVVKNRLGSFS